MKDFFSPHRQKLANKLNGGIVVITAYSGMQRGNDMAFGFEQEANFWWLTGIEAADWWLIIDGIRHKSWLVVPMLNKSHETFSDSQTLERAQDVSGVDGVVMRDEAMILLRDLAKKHSVVYTIGEQPYEEYFNFSLNPAPRRMHDMLERIFNSVQDCRKELAELRAIKQPEEIMRIKKAINLTVDAFKSIKTKLQDMKYEYEVEAEFTYYFRKNGAKGHAYDPIVASGKNACMLHYTNNDAKLKKRELLLLDIGARHQGYAADITRTYALGEPTKRQAVVHSAVQSAQKQIISLLKPHLLVAQYQSAVDKIMIDTLLNLGLMSSRDDEQGYRKYFPHAVSHGLGVDVRDYLGRPRFLQPGVVLTVEPGIYIPEEEIGVRIEDNILITETGYTNLSARLSTDL